MNGEVEYYLRQGVWNMYDGGWRSSDREDLFLEYEDMTEEEADIIIDQLRKIEEMIAEEGDEE